MVKARFKERSSSNKLRCLINERLKEYFMNERNVISEHTVNTGKQTVRYLTCGSGDIPVVFLHGWPQCAEEYRHIMKLLPSNFKTYAMDLRGIGGTSSPSNDWTKETLAHDLHDFINTLNLERPVVVGHDLGGAVAYAYARLYPDSLRGFGVMDMPIPGITPWEAVIINPILWHFDFHAQEPLAEDLIIGQQQVYFRYFFNHVGYHTNKISDDDVAMYAAAYETRDQLRAGFGLYRAFPEDAQFGKKHTGALDVPMMLAGGGRSVGQQHAEIISGLKDHGVRNIKNVIIEDSGHWVCEEQPERTAAAIEAFANKLR